VSLAADDDPALVAVHRRLVELLVPDPVTLFGRAIRRSIDEVLDGPRTGRWDFFQLEKTEKTYVGTKIEIVVRTALGLERGPNLDLEIEGNDVDIKWAMKSKWQIPLEAVGELCLCIGGLANLSQFQVALIRCSESVLTPGPGNRDRKRTISALGQSSLLFLVEPTALPTNFVGEMDPEVRRLVMEEPTIQRRVTLMFNLLPRTPVPRLALQTVARTQGDPVRRTRADKSRGDPLDGMVVLSTKYGSGVAQALGLEPMPPDSFMAVPRREIELLPDAARQKLSAAARRRYELDGERHESTKDATHGASAIATEPLPPLGQLPLSDPRAPKSE
jgi:hypothetical protein